MPVRLLITINCTMKLSRFINKIFTLACIAATSILVSSCGEYVKVQKSNDPNYKFDYAKRAFAEKKYQQAATILKDLITQFKGTDKAEESLYLLAMSNYENKDYI
ncbi:MAG: hypothetical protein K2K84_02530, partial [Muribaculaceae bacterium]|nr:hypothetical protein [Muribaculaceae bacterium]